MVQAYVCMKISEYPPPPPPGGLTFLASIMISTETDLENAHFKIYPIYIVNA